MEIVLLLYGLLIMIMQKNNFIFALKKTDEKMKACKNEEWLDDFKEGKEHAFRVVFDEYYKILCYFAPMGCKIEDGFTDIFGFQL